MLITTVVFWALNFTVSKYILEHGFEPIQYSSTRYVIAAAIFAGITYVSERSFRVSRRDLGILLGCACLLFVNQIGFVYSLHFTTATTVALIFGTLPIFTGLIAAATGVEKLTSRFALAAGVSFAGVALVATGDGGGLSADVKGDLLALLGAATWAAYSVAIGPLMTRYSPYRISFVVLTATTVMLGLAGSRQFERRLAGRMAGLARLRLCRGRPARAHERALVPRHPRGRAGPRLALCEPAVLPGRDLRRPAALRVDLDRADRRRPCDRRRHPARTARARRRRGGGR